MQWGGAAAIYHLPAVYWLTRNGRAFRVRGKVLLTEAPELGLVSVKSGSWLAIVLLQQRTLLRRDLCVKLAGAIHRLQLLASERDRARSQPGVTGDPALHPHGIIAKSIRVASRFVTARRKCAEHAMQFRLAGE